MEKNECARCETRNVSNARYCCGCGYELPRLNLEQLNQGTQSKPVETSRKGNLKIILGIAAGALFLLVIVCSFTFYQLFFKTHAIDPVLMKSASELNKTCPIMIDSETRLDNAVALPGKVVQYNYTLVNYEKSAIDTIVLKKTIEPKLINDAKTNPQQQYQRDNKITMTFYYKDKNGLYVCSITVKPE